MMDERQGLITCDGSGASATPWKLAVLLASIVAIIGIGISIGFGVQLSSYKTRGNTNYEADCQLFQQGYIPRETVTLPPGRLLIKNASVWMADGTISYATDIYIVNGLINKIAVNMAPEPGVQVIDAMGAFATPGLVDMHSHAGVYSFPEDAHANQDGNEMTNPAVPHVRAIDAFAPEDSSIGEARLGGVTAAQILPGSGNVMGGQAFQVKYRLYTDPTVDQLRIKNGPVALKMACGENPKRVYGDRHPPELPMSRMGNGWVMRQKLGAGKDLLTSQQQYCQAGPRETPFPHDYSMDNVLALLRGQAVLNIHCYKVVDFEMAIRVAKEFGVKIASFHHAMEAWKIPQIMKENNITIALFSDQFGFKFEARHASVHSPRLLDSQGVAVALKTDHPVINGRDLIYQAQKAAHWGLNPTAALRAVTSTPANAIGLGDRIGSLAVGKEADIVLWDRHPLHLGASPIRSIIEGQTVLEQSLPVQHDKLSYVSPWNKYSMTSEPATVCSFVTQSANGLPSYAVTNARIFFGDSRAPITGSIVVQNGLVTCVGTCTPPNGAATFDMQGGIVTPGMIYTGAPLGLTEVEQESSWSDGSVTDLNPSVQAIDGVTVESQHTYAAWVGGVLTAVARPASSKVVMGQSSAFFMGPSIRVLDSSTAVKGAAALEVQLGNSAKSGWSPSVSQQIAGLRASFLEANKTALVTNPLYQVILGQLPLVIWTNSADHMTAVIRMIDDLRFTDIKLVFGGASEAWLVASELKRVNAGVIIYRCAPNSFEGRRCNYKAAITELKKNGIRIGYTGGIGDVIAPRFLRWEVGMAREYGIDSIEEGVRMVSGNIAAMYNLPPGVGDITVGGPANFVGYTSDPFSTLSNIEFVAVSSKFECRPQQK